MPTDNREYNLPKEGEVEWHVPVNENWKQIDADVQTALDTAQEALDAATGDTDTGSSDGSTRGGTGFTWDQTHTDTSWLTDAGDDVAVEVVTSTDPDELEGAASGDDPTIVVFEAGGTFDLGGGELRIEGDNTWVAGETAPDPGVNIAPGTLRVDGDNVIVSHVGAYLGSAANDPGAGSAIDPNGDDVVFDYCTAAWGTDETVGIAEPVDRVSFINCVITESCFFAGHPEGKHSRCFTVSDDGADNLAIMGSFMGNSNRRHPQTKGDMVLVNNWVHNYGGVAGHTNNGRDPDVDMIGCHYEEGPDSDDDIPIWQYSGTVYFEDVKTDGHPLAGNGADEKGSPSEIPDGLDLDTDVLSSSDVREFVLLNAGQRPASRHALDQDIKARMKEGQHIDNEEDVGGYPEYGETDHTLNVPSSGRIDWVFGHRNAISP